VSHTEEVSQENSTSTGVNMAEWVAARKKAEEARMADQQAHINVDTPINVNYEDSAEE
jgi:hypothetical protein